MLKKLPFAQYALKDLLVYGVVLAALGIGLVLVAILLKLWWLLAPAGLVFALLAFVVSFFRDPKRDIPEEPGILVSPADGTVQDIEHLPRGDPRNMLDVPAVRIGIFLSIFNVHVNRAPMAGRVSRVEYRRGRFLPAYDVRAASENESNTVWVEAEAGEEAGDRSQESGVRSRESGIGNNSSLTVGASKDITGETPVSRDIEACLPKAADMAPEITGGTPVLQVAVKQISGVAARRIVCPAKIGDQLERGQRYGMIKFGSRTELYVPEEQVAEILVQVGAKVRGGADLLVRLKGI